MICILDVHIVCILESSYWMPTWSVYWTFSGIQILDAHMVYILDVQQETVVQVAKDKADAAEVAGETPTDKSMFHGKSLKDYAGRSWLEAPKDLKAENEHCFLPKRWVHTWSGHTKGVNAIRSGPLLVVVALA